MRSQKPLPNPPEEYNKRYMYDLASIVIEDEAISAKTNRDNVFDTGSIIIRQPDGDYRKIVVDNSGNLSTTAVTTDNFRPITGTNPYV